MPVCSLAGVVLIARPAFLFGQAVRDVLPDPGAAVGDAVGTGPESATLVTPEQRLIAVGYVSPKRCYFMLRADKLPRVALLGVCGATGACESLYLDRPYAG